MPDMNFDFFNENYRKFEEVSKLGELFTFNLKNELKQHKMLNRKNSLLHKILSIDYCYHKIKETVNSITESFIKVKLHSIPTGPGMVKIDIPDSNFWNESQSNNFECIFYFDEFFGLIGLLFRDVALFLNVFVNGRLGKKIDIKFVKNVKENFKPELFELFNEYLCFYYRIKSIRDAIEHSIPNMIENFLFTNDNFTPKFVFIDIYSFFVGFDYSFTQEKFTKEHKRMEHAINNLYLYPYIPKEEFNRIKLKNIDIIEFITEIIEKLSKFLTDFLNFLIKEYK